MARLYALRRPPTIRPLPDLINDESFAVHLSDDYDTEHCYFGPSVYCGRYLGEEIIPDSDGQCGPDYGPQCPSCERLQRGRRTRIDILKRIYPGFRLKNAVRPLVTNETKISGTCGNVVVEEEEEEEESDFKIEEKSGRAEVIQNENCGAKIGCSSKNEVENMKDDHIPFEETLRKDADVKKEIISIDALIAGLMRRHYGNLGSLLKELNDLEVGDDDGDVDSDSTIDSDSDSNDNREIDENEDSDDNVDDSNDTEVAVSGNSTNSDNFIENISVNETVEMQHCDSGDGDGDTDTVVVMQQIKSEVEENMKDDKAPKSAKMRVKLNIALSTRTVHPPSTRRHEEVIKFLSDAVNIGNDDISNPEVIGCDEDSRRFLAEYALMRHDYELEHALEWITGGVESVKRRILTAKKKLSAKEKKVEKLNSERLIAVEEAYTLGLEKVFAIPFTSGTDFDPICSPSSTMSMPVATQEETIDHSKVSDLPPELIIKNGHRMVLATKVERSNEIKSDSVFPESIKVCPICASIIPSPSGGLYYCQHCHLCEGCIQSPSNPHQPIQSPYTVEPKTIIDGENGNAKGLQRSQCRPLSAIYCTGLRNGGHLHHHAMKFEPDNFMNATCDIEGPGCLGECIVWSCRICQFDVCLTCAREPAPQNYNRKMNSFIDDQYTSEDVAMRDYFSLHSLFANDGETECPIESDQDGGDGSQQTREQDEEKNESSSPIRRFFDEKAAERTVAARWEELATSSVQMARPHRTILGTGAVGNMIEKTPDTKNTSEISLNLPQLKVPAEGRLSYDAKVALFLFRNSRLNDDRSTEVAAADVTHVEDLLRRVAGDVNRESNLSYATLLDAVSAGKLGIAGSMLLSRAYAPIFENISDENGNTTEEEDLDNVENEKKQEVMCWCGFPIDFSSAPSGAVGCLGGHAMHASCASDLLLGGGKCPTCRQPLFFARVSPTEVKAAATFAKGEIRRARLMEEERVKSELEELKNKGLEMTWNLEDVVLVSPDKEFCKEVMISDTIGGGWHEEMAMSCGLEGRISEIIFDNGDVIGGNSNGVVISIRVVSRGRHKFEDIRLIDDYICRKCDKERNGQRRCKQCQFCEYCCRQTLRTCEERTHAWYWSPILLTLLRRADGNILGVADEDDDDDATLAERHILRLRGELVAIKAAREAVKAETDKLLPLPALPPNRGFRRQLSSGSESAILDMVSSGISPPDYVRARHFLLLARQWGDSDEAKAKRATLYGAIREGNLDSVARIVRRHNAARTVDMCTWKDAKRETAEYVVDPCAAVNLRSFPGSMAPRTGFTLSPQAKFTSSREILDEEGHMWIEVLCSDDDNYDGVKEPPPQGWLKVRPGGDGSAPIVRRSETAILCFGCKGKLIPPVSLQRYTPVKRDDIKDGDVLLVAATLETVVVKSCVGPRIYCSFFNVTKNASSAIDNSVFASSVWYRACDLVKPSTDEKIPLIDEMAIVDGRLRSRRELILALSGDEVRARKVWDAANGANPFEDYDYASCARGHLLHARCLQEALVSGSRCPSPGCMEQLFLPSIIRSRNDDDVCVSCNMEDDQGERAALQAASELAGHAALLEARATEGVVEPGRDLAMSGVDEFKMCPMCCSGPLFNQECSDMGAHHGQCATIALRGGDFRQCTPEGDFHASASEIAARMALVSPTKSVADLLPRCETHNVLVMFNGCMVCGHLFTDTSWEDMPKWNPKARTLLEMDQKRRNAARLLTEQIRAEAAMLQFERDALWEGGERSGECEEREGGWCGKNEMEKIIEHTSASP